MFAHLERPAVTVTGSSAGAEKFFIYLFYIFFLLAVRRFGKGGFGAAKRPNSFPKEN